MSDLTENPAEPGNTSERPNQPGVTDHHAEIADLTSRAEAAEAARDAAIEMVKTCTGHPDRANPAVPSHPELIQQANAERDEARAKLDEIRGVLVNHAAHAMPYALLHSIHEVVERPAAAPATYVCPGCGKVGRQRQPGEKLENDPKCADCISAAAPAEPASRILLGVEAIAAEFARLQGAHPDANGASVGTEDIPTIYIGIGNSDDKLTQREWRRFIAEVRRELTDHNARIIGEWFSLPDKPWQNAEFAFQAGAAVVAEIRACLIDLAPAFEQDSIAWAVATTEFLGADRG